MQIHPVPASPAIIIRLPLSPKRRAGRKYLVAPDGATVPAAEETTQRTTMQRALARAFLWRKEIETGEHESLADYARGRGLNPDYVYQQMALTFLSPAIIESILDNTLPRHVTLQHLLKVAREQLWEAQELQLCQSDS